MWSGRQNVTHREHAAPTNEPRRGNQRAFGKHATVARDVLEMNLFKRRVEDEFVRTGNGAGANACNRNLSSGALPRPCSGRRLAKRQRRSRRRVHLCGMMGFDNVRGKTWCAPE